MFPSYSRTRPLIYVHILALQFFLRSVSSLNLTNAYLKHVCRDSEGKYNSGSKYEENFESHIRRTSTSLFLDGFDHSTHGTPSISSTIIFQCRGDSYGSKCRSCFATAIAGLRRRCQKNKGAIIWYDQCFLDVSPINRKNPRDIDKETAFSMQNPNNVRGDSNSFNKKIRDFLHELILKADKTDVDGLNLLYYAGGEEKIGMNKVYAMVQCAKDILDCKGCLKWSISKLPECCNGKQGARVLSTSCNIRYEIYPFLRT